jgi:protein-disulfide isomerase
MPLARRRGLVAGLALLIGATLAGRAAHAVDAGPIVVGDKNAPVTIIEFASLDCPHCAAFQTEVMPELKKRYLDTGKAKLEFHDFPLHEIAVRAAQLVHCAGPDRAEKFADVIFRQQRSWEVAKDPLAALKQLVKLGGLTDDQINACLSDKALEDAILQSRLDGEQKYQVDSTPTFIIDGKKYAGERSIDELAQIIDPLLPK